MLYAVKTVKSSTYKCENHGIGAAFVILNLLLFTHTLFIMNCHFTITLNIFHIILTPCVVITQGSQYLVASFQPTFTYTNLYGNEKSDEYITKIHLLTTLGNTEF